MRIKSDLEEFSAACPPKVEQEPQLPTLLHWRRGLPFGPLGGPWDQLGYLGLPRKALDDLGMKMDVLFRIIFGALSMPVSKKWPPGIQRHSKPHFSGAGC